MMIPGKDPSSNRTGLVALVAAAALAAAVGLAACSEDSSEGSGGEAAVIATTGVAADIVSEITGADLEVGQLVPDGASPHSYAPSAKDQQRLAAADLLVYFSPALEQSLPLDAAANRLAIADHVESVRELEDRGGSAEADHDHDETTKDPHVWLDPTQIEAALPAIADALAGIDPEHAADFERRAAAYAEELAALDAELEQLTEAIPAGDRKLVSSHDLLGYFADRYGFEFIGAPFGASPEAEASAGELAELIEAVEAEGVPALFAQSGDDPEVLRQVASEAGVLVVDDLLLESLGEGAGSYVEMMRLSTRKISDALSG